jgi:mRNA interferase HicA
MERHCRRSVEALDGPPLPPKPATAKAQQGCTFESGGNGSHEIVRLGKKMSVLPRHGSSKELGTGLVQNIKEEPGAPLMDPNTEGRRWRR